MRQYGVRSVAAKALGDLVLSVRHWLSLASAADGGGAAAAAAGGGGELSLDMRMEAAKQTAKLDNRCASWDASRPASTAHAPPASDTPLLSRYRPRLALFSQMMGLQRDADGEAIDAWAPKRVDFLLLAIRALVGGSITRRAQEEAASKGNSTKKLGGGREQVTRPASLTPPTFSLTPYPSAASSRSSVGCPTT